MKKKEAPLEIVIKSDGQVVLLALTEEMLELAQTLAPQDERLKRRRKRAPSNMSNEAKHETRPDDGN